MKTIISLLTSLLLASNCFASEQIFNVGNSSNMNGSNGVTAYTTLFQGGFGWGTTAFGSPLAHGLTIRGFDIDIEIAPGSGKSFTITLTKNGSDTAISCVIADSATGCTSNAEVSFAAGDLIGLKSLCTGSPTTVGDSWWVVRASVDGNNISLIDGGTSLQSNVTRFFNPLGGGGSASEVNVQSTLIPINGQITKLYAAVDTAPGASKSIVVTVRKNFSDTAMTCTISDSNTSCSDTTNSFTVVPGDDITMKYVSSASISSTTIVPSLAFASDKANLFILPGAFLTNVSPNNYSLFHKLNSGAEADNIAQSGTLVFRSVYYKQHAAPGVGASETITLRKNQTTNTALTCTISDLNQTCEGTTAVTAALGDYYGMTYGQTGSPAAAQGRFSLVGEVVHTNIIGKATIGKAHF